ncbi:MAG: carboxypeptidase regulatory-like domain-containing protein [Nitrospirota bacterium]
MSKAKNFWVLLLLGIIICSTSYVHAGFVGKVTKFDGMTPISGVLVKALQEDVVKAVIDTDASGNYTLSVPSGTYKINVSHAGYITQIFPRVNSGTTSTLNFALLSGNVVVLDEFEQVSLDTTKWKTHIMNNGSVHIGTNTYSDETFKCVGLDTRYPGGPDSAAITSKFTASVVSDKIIFDSRISVYEEWGNVYGDGQPRGLRVGTDPNNAIEFISTSGYGIQARTVSGGIATITNYNFGSLRTRIIYRIEATANQVKFFVNGNSIATHTTNIPTGVLNIYMGSYDGGAGNVPVSGDYLLLGTQLPTIDILVNQGTFTVGETAKIGVAVNNPGAPITTDVRICVKLPTEAYVPIIKLNDFTIPAGTLGPINLLSYKFTGGEPEGTYEAIGKLLHPCSGEYLAEDIEPFIFDKP